MNKHNWMHNAENYQLVWGQDLQCQNEGAEQQILCVKFAQSAFLGHRCEGWHVHVATVTHHVLCCWISSSGSSVSARHSVLIEAFDNELWLPACNDGCSGKIKCPNFTLKVWLQVVVEHKSKQYVTLMCCVCSHFHVCTLMPPILTQDEVNGWPHLPWKQPHYFMALYIKDPGKITS